MKYFSKRFLLCSLFSLTFFLGAFFALFLQPLNVFADSFSWSTRVASGQRAWRDVTSSADGTKLAAVVAGGYIYTSTDSGVTWTEMTSSGSRTWEDISSSSDGLKLAATVATGYIYTSDDGGVTWNERTALGSVTWADIAYSADGTTLVVAPESGYLNISTNDGSSWTQNTSGGTSAWIALDVSSDGQVIVAGQTNNASSDNVLSSTNGGTNWTTNSLPGVSGGSINHDLLGDIFVVSEGDIMIASRVSITEEARTYRSTNSGVNWSIAQDETFQLYDIDGADDGSRIFAVPSSSGAPFYSTNNGVSWSSESGAGSRSWRGVASSYDGKKVVATVDNGYIYTGVFMIPATVTSNTASSVGPISAVLNGSITNTGNASTTQHGFAYGTSATLSTVIATSTLGTYSGTGNFTSTVSSLSVDTTYYFRAYATNSAGTSYGEITSFTTSSAIPATVATNSASSVTSSSATLNGAVSSTGGANATEHGFAYGLSSNLTTQVIGTTTLGALVGATSFTSGLNSLSASTTYYARAYSTNSAGTGYGSIVSFTTSSSAVPYVTTADASSLTATTATLNGTLLENIGTFWTAQTDSGSKQWTDLAASTDGLKVVGVVDGEFFHTSTDGGVNWTERSDYGTQQWTSVASSADGDELVFTTRATYIYTSTDSGVTITEQTASYGDWLNRDWSSVAMSSDGTKIVATVSDSACVNSCSEGYVYTSTDSGVTWTEQVGLGLGYWSDVASSADGLTLIVANWATGYVYTSIDGGSNWTERTDPGTGNWYTVSVSSDGTKMAVAGNGTSIFTSTDSGANWTERSDLGQLNWREISMSADGSKIVVSDNDSGEVYYSTDSGVTWSSYGISAYGPWSGIAMKSDGSDVVLAQSNGYIYTDSAFQNPTTRGFVYGSTTAYGATTTESGSFDAGAFSSSLSSLTCATTYHYRAYATNSSGTSYGPIDTTFVTSDCPVSSDDDDTPAPVVRGGGPIFLSGASFALPENLKPRPQTIYPDGRIVYHDVAPVAGDNLNVGSSNNQSPDLSGVSNQSSVKNNYNFTRDLQLWDRGEDVRELQRLLNSLGFLVSEDGPGSLGNETSIFGNKTRLALIDFQKARNISPAHGYFGPITRSAVNWK